MLLDTVDGPRLCCRCSGAALLWQGAVLELRSRPAGALV